MPDGTEPWQQRAWVRYTLCYLLYIVLVILAAVVVFFVWRQTFLVIISLIAGTTRVSPVSYMLCMIVSTFAAFILLMIAEPYLRNGVEKYLLWRRFARLAIPLAIIGAVGLILNIWAFWTFGDIEGSTLRTTPTAHIVQDAAPGAVGMRDRVS